MFSFAYLFILYVLLKQRAMELGCGRVLLFFIVKIKHNLLININTDIFYNKLRGQKNIGYDFKWNGCINKIKLEIEMKH